MKSPGVFHSCNAGAFCSDQPDSGLSPSCSVIVVYPPEIVVAGGSRFKPWRHVRYVLSFPGRLLTTGAEHRISCRLTTRASVGGENPRHGTPSSSKRSPQQQQSVIPVETDADFARYVPFGDYRRL